MTEFLLCKNCPWNEAHALLRMVDPTIIGCNFFLVGGRKEETIIVHQVEKNKHD